MVPAGMTLVLHGLDYVEQTKGVTIGNNEIDTATKIFIQTISPKIGLPPDKMQEATDHAHRAMQDPALMAKFNAQHQGVA